MTTIRSPQEPPNRRRIRLHRSLYRSWQLPFLTTICTAGRRPVFSLHPELAASAAATILGLAPARGTRLHAWCVMPDHVHLLLEDGDVLEFVRGLKGRLTVVARGTLRGRLWQRGFHDHALRAEEGLLDAARYVLSNPARAGIAGAAREYRWSGSETFPNWRTWPEPWGRG